MKQSNAVETTSSKMQTSVLEYVDSVKAQRWLDRNTSNRKLRDGWVEKYTSDMLAGKWTECIVPIVFYENGDIADGQHRLWAIIESGTTQRFFVLYGLSREAGLNIDTGGSRTLVDNARISGLNADITNEMTAVARALESGARTSSAMSNSSLLTLVEKHREVLKWVCAHGPRGKGLRNQCILAAVARAWYYTDDKEKLARFCQVVSTGMMQDGGESAAVALRNLFLTNRNVHLNQLFREYFLLAQAAIKAFMHSRPITRLRTPVEEPYPLTTKPLVFASAKRRKTGAGKQRV
jgi:hypothetical protein